MALKIIAFCLLVGAVVVARLLFLTPDFEGKWSQSGGDENFSWYINYTFSWGTYSFEGYPPTSGGGTYSIVSEENGNYILELRPHGEAGEESSLADLRVSEDGQTLDWAGSKYSRVK